MIKLILLIITLISSSVFSQKNPSQLHKSYSDFVNYLTNISLDTIDTTLTAFPAVGHNPWDSTYENHELCKGMHRNKKIKN